MREQEGDLKRAMKTAFNMLKRGAFSEEIAEILELPARNDPFLSKGSGHTGIAASICAVFQISKTDTEALSGAFFFFVFGQRGTLPTIFRG